MAIPVSLLVSVVSNATPTAGPRKPVNDRKAMGSREVDRLLRELNAMAQDRNSAVYRLMQPVERPAHKAPAGATHAAKRFAPTPPVVAPAAPAAVAVPEEALIRYEVWKLTDAGLERTGAQANANRPTVQEADFARALVRYALKAMTHKNAQGLTHFSVNLLRKEEIVNVAGDSSKLPRWPYQLNVRVTDDKLLVQLYVPGSADIHVIAKLDAALALDGVSTPVAGE